MKVKIILLALALIALGYFAFTRVTPSPITGTPSPTPQGPYGVSEEPVSYEASFEIYTNGTKRIFTASMYHNLSERVYITADNPSMVFVRASGVTWGEFFETLPMELTSKCLITGTGQRFCDGEGGSLEFYINGELVGDFLEREIKDKDEALITFTSK